MADAPDNSDDHPVRYVITNMAHPEGSLAGLRVLTFPAWGSRYTYATREEAEEQMKLYEPDLRAKILGDRADTLLVLAVQCWPGWNAFMLGTWKRWSWQARRSENWRSRSVENRTTRCERSREYRISKKSARCSMQLLSFTSEPVRRLNKSETRYVRTRSAWLRGGI